jgi:hypothetical protein
MILGFVLAGLAAAAGTAVEKAPVPKRATLVAVGQAVDGRIGKIVPADPMEVLSSTQGVYLGGYGAVFTAQVDLIMTPTPNPFRMVMSKKDIEQVHARKAARIPMLRQSMREALKQAAADLENLPPREQVVLAISILYYHWEDSSGMPSQIVMQAPREKLLNRETAEAAIQTLEN